MNSSPRTGPPIYKFGGTSLADPVRIANVADLIADATRPPVVVVSATGETTDHLAALLGASPDVREALMDRILETHQGMLGRFDADEELRDQLRRCLGRARTGLPELEEPHSMAQGRDRVLSLGEDLSAWVVTAALRAGGVAAQPVDARTVIRTDRAFGQARPGEAAVRDLAASRVLPLLAQGVVPVLQGFVGATSDGSTTTLGRGGSDLTATLLGAAMDAEEVHIWTDVDGVLSADPRIVDEPRVLDVVGFEEAVELAYFGARVLHPGAAKLAVARGVPVRIRSTFQSERPGTLILRDRWGGPGIAAVASKPDVSLIKVRGRPSSLPYGFLARVFEILARNRLAVDLVATSHTSTAFTIDGSEDLGVVAPELQEVADVEVRTGLATVTVVGNGLLQEPGFDARVFEAVGHVPIHLVSQASDVSLSLVVDQADAESLVRRLHHALVASRVEVAPP